MNMRRALLRTGLGLGLGALVVVGVALMVDRGGPDVTPPVAAGEPPAEPGADLARVTADPWAAPASPTTSRMFYTRFETIGVEDGLPSPRVTAVYVDGDDLWVGTEHGLAIRRSGTWTTYDRKDGLAHPYVTSIDRDPLRDEIWISTLAGVSRFSGGVFTNYTQLNSGLMNDVVYHVLLSGDLVWVGTGAGASVLDRRTGTWALYDTDNSIMHEPWVYTVATGPGRTWLGLWGGCLAELDHGTGLWREYRDPDGEMEIDLLRDDGPIHEVTSFISYDEGVLWQATYFGLARYDGRTWRSYLAKDTGLPGDFISHVAARGHTAWIASDQGLGVFDGQTCVTYRHRDDGGCDVIVWKDGAETERRVLDTGPPDDYVLWVHPRERDVWFATGDGLCHGIAED